MRSASQTFRFKCVFRTESGISRQLAVAAFSTNRSNHPFRTSLPPITARIAERPVGARISGLGVVGALNEGEFWRKGPKHFLSNATSLAEIMNSLTKAFR